MVILSRPTKMKLFAWFLFKPWAVSFWPTISTGLVKSYRKSALMTSKKTATSKFSIRSLKKHQSTLKFKINSQITSKNQQSSREIPTLKSKKSLFQSFHVLSSKNSSKKWTKTFGTEWYFSGIFQKSPCFNFPNIFKKSSLIHRKSFTRGANKSISWFSTTVSSALLLIMAAWKHMVKLSKISV